jgi:uncharacterized protein
MATALHCLYRPGGAEDRLAIRDVHLKYMIGNACLVRAGGAVVDPSGGVTGMYVLLETDDPARVEAFLEGEPYHAARLFSRVEWLRVQVFMPEPHGGFLDGLLAQSRAVALQRRAGRGSDDVMRRLRHGTP